MPREQRGGPGGDESLSAAHAPWDAVLTSTEHDLIQFGIAVAGFALIAMLVRSIRMSGEVSSRYRPAVAASLSVLTVAALSYALILVFFLIGYREVDGQWVPAGHAKLVWSARYLDWAVTVPLLVVEVVAVSSLVGRRAALVRRIGASAAFLMIATGYLGGVAVGDGQDFGALLGWGLVSTVFFIVLYGLVLATVLPSLPALPSVARPPYLTAMVLLMVTWFVYPVVFGLQGFTDGGVAATTGQLLLCAADVLAKVGFGLLIHRVAKLRTAFDVEAGIDAHPETLWVDGSRVSTALLPVSVEFARPAAEEARQDGRS